MQYVLPRDYIDLQNARANDTNMFIYIYIYEAVHHFSRCTYRRARGLPAPWSDYSATRLQFPSEAFPAVRAGFGEHAADSRLSFSFPSSKDR